MTTVNFTSFRRLEEEGTGPAWSIAVYQPKGFDLPKAEWADIRDTSCGRDGRWTRPKEFTDWWDPLAAYRDALWALYLSREADIEAWLDGLDHEPYLTLVCWCPFVQASQRQLEQHGTFVCHSEVIRGFLTFRLGLFTTLDMDRFVEMKSLFGERL